MPGDDERIKRNELLIAKQTTEISRLQTEIKSKEVQLNTISQSKAALEGENTTLKTALDQKTGQIQSLEREKALLNEKYRALDVSSQKLAAEKDHELAKLKLQIEELSQTRNPDEVLIKELSASRIQLETLKQQSEVNTRTLIEAQADLALREAQAAKMTQEVADLNKLLADFQTSHASIRNELELLRGKIKSSYSPEELSSYLGDAIQSFNRQDHSEDPGVGYVINSMDIDLKTQIFSDQQNGVRFAPADLGTKSEQSLSSVKISIRAVPKL